MRMIRGRRVLGGVVAGMLVVGGVSGVLAASSGATRPVAKAAAVASGVPTPRPPLGGMTALAWRVQTPVGARMVLWPVVRFDLPAGALRVLRATKPRLSGAFVVRIVSTGAGGGSRALVVVSRRVNGLAIATSAVRSVLGRQLRLRQWVLTRKQTQAVKRAARGGRLALTISARYSVSYQDARGRRVLTPARSGSATLPVALKPQAARGSDLRKLIVPFQQLLGQAGQLKLACVTRNTVVGQLRDTYSAMVSGDRTGTAALLQLYIYDAEAMRTAGLLNPQQANLLASGLGSLLGRVGSGQSKRIASGPRWPPLPGCGATASRAHIAFFGIALALHKALKALRRWAIATLVTAAVATPVSIGIGIGVGGLREILWPPDPTDKGIAAAVPEGDPTGANQVLDNLKVQMDNFVSWEQCCLKTNPGYVGSLFDLTVKNFTDNRWRFQPSSAYYSLSDQLELLPLFAEYVNTYLTMLHEGVVYGTYWGLTPDTVLGLEDKIRAELDPNNPASAVGYSQKVYDAGLVQQGSSTDPQTNFAKTNAYKREMQLAVLDVRAMWHFQDPMAYPYGDPGFRQDRIIYSDAVGTTTQTFAPPANPVSPLSALTAWTTRVTYGSHSDQNWLAAIQADNSPQVGVRTGAAGGAPTTYSVAPGSTPGPVVQVDTTRDQKSSGSQQLIGTAQLHFSDGTTAAPGGNFYDRGSPYTTSWTFDDEVLAAVKIMGSYPMTSSTAVGDSMVLGFRFADSFSTQWKGSLPGALRAPSTQACLAVERTAITSGTHIGATSGSRSNGAAVQMNACNGAWEQNWRYIDYNDPNNSNDDAIQHELTVYAGTKCLAPKTDANGNWVTGGGFPTASSSTWPPPPHTLVAVYDCDATAAQKWTVNADGTIRPADASNLCLDRWNGSTANGTAIQLYTCTGNPAQAWARP